MWHTKYAATLWKCHRNAGEELEENPVKKNTELTSAAVSAEFPLTPQAAEHYINSTGEELLLRVQQP